MSTQKSGNGTCENRLSTLRMPGWFAGLMALTLTLQLAGAVCFSPPAGLIGWWPGDGNANNLLGTNHGILQGGALASAGGMVGNAFSFDGTNSYVQIPNSTVLQPTNLTVECWVRFAGLDSPGTAAVGVQYIVFKQNTRTANFEGFDLGKSRVGGNDVFRFIVSAAGGQSISLQSTTTISAGVWYHVAAVRGGNVAQLYVNGVLERQTNVTFAQNYGNFPLYFGTSGQSYWDRKLKGDLDEVTLYQRALSAGEIAAIYSAGAAGKCKGTSVPSSLLVNVDFDGSAPSGKTGPAAIGQSYGDFWNAYEGAGAWHTDGTLAFLKAANGSNTQIGLSVPNTPGSWGNYSSDVMYNGYIYPEPPAGIAITVTNLPPAKYDFYLYSSDGNFELTSAGTNYGNRVSLDNPVVSPPVWEEGRQYVVYRDVVVTNPAQPVIINVGLGAFGYAIVSGMQITASLAPFIAQQPTNTAVVLGTSLLLQTLGTGTPAPAYQWYFNGSPVSNGGRVHGATSNLLTIADAQLADAGGYFAVLTNTSGAVTSLVATVQVGARPTLVQSPASQTNLVGSVAQFTGSFTSVEPLTFRWFFNGNPVADDPRHSGATNTSLIITDLVAGDAGAYRVVAGNLFGNTTSAVASLTVLIPPSIVQPPQSQVSFFGATAAFSVTATGDGPLSYQWQLNAVPLTDDDRHGGSASSFLSLANLQPSDVGNYSVVVTNSVGAVTSAVAVLSAQALTLVNVDLDGNAQSGKTGPAAIGQGSNDFWNPYLGAGAWQTHGTLALLKLANGSNTPVGLTIPNTPGSWGNYSSDPMYQGYIYPQPPAGITITLTNLPLGLYSFYLYSADGNFQLTSAGTSYGSRSSLDNPVVSPPVWQEGRQYVAFRDVAVSNTTQTVVVNVGLGAFGYATVSGIQIAHDLAPWISIPPSNTLAAIGGNLVLCVAGDGAPSPGYQWFYQGTPLTNDTRIAGATSNVLVIANAQPADAGNYWVVLANSGGAVTSSVAAVELGLGPNIELQPTSLIGVVGGGAQFSVQATGAEPLTYQWYQNTTALVDDARRTGATTTNLIITNLVTGDTGNYTLRLVNAYGSVTSAVANLTVFTPPAISTQPRGYSVPIGLPVTLAGAASGTAPLRYQWQLDGVPVVNATNAGLTISNLAAANFGSYQLVVTNGGGAVTSAVAAVTVGQVGTWGTFTFTASAPIWPAAGLSNVVAVAAGSGYSLALRQDGTVYAWGFNNPATNVPSGLSGVVAIAAGQSHALAVLSNGLVRAWGSSASGVTNVPVTLSNVIAVAAGSAHSAALRSDGTMVVWGGGSVEGQTNIPSGLMKIVGLDAGGSQTLALREDGRLFGWGGRTQYPVPYDLKGVMGFSAGPAFSALNLALTSNGLLRAWGGVGTATNVPASATNIMAVEGAGGGDQSTGVVLALRSNRTVLGWGGQVGASSLTNVPAGLSNVLALSGGLTHALALIDDGRPLIIQPPVGGTFYSGRDLVLKAKVVGNAPLSFQWFKNGNPIPGGTEQTLVLPFAQATDAGSYHLVAMNALGTAQSVAVPVAVVNQAPVLMSQPQSRFAHYGSPFSVGASVNGSGPMEFQWLQNGVPAYFGTNDLVFDRALPQHGGSYQLIASNPFGSVTSGVAQITFSRVASWGNGPSLTNAPVDLGSVRGVASGYFHALAIRSDGTVAAWGTTANGATNVPADLSNVVAIAGGNYFSVALKADGKVVAWGLNSAGQTNVPAGLSNVTAIAVGDRHALALSTDGTVTGWGLTGLASVPAGLSNVVAIAAGSVHSLALKNDGTIVGWGSFGKIPNYTNVVAIAAGWGQSVALQADGTVLAWSTGGGATGFPAGGISNVVAISMGGGWQGFSHGAALKADGTVVMWGNNANGQLNVTPDLTSAIALSAGGGSTLAYLNDRSAFVATQPLDRHAVSGTNVTFAALSVGQPSLNFQWRRNGADIPGATGPTLTLTNVSRDARGNYAALVWNALGSTNSRDAWLDVVGPVKLLPPVTGSGVGESVSFAVGDPAGQSVNAEDAAWLEAQASTNLVNWETLPDSIVFTNGMLFLQDPAQSNHPARFYRLLER